MSSKTRTLLVAFALTLTASAVLAGWLTTRRDIGSAKLLGLAYERRFTGYLARGPEEPA